MDFSDDEITDDMLAGIDNLVAQHQSRHQTSSQLPSNSPNSNRSGRAPTHPHAAPTAAGPTAPPRSLGLPPPYSRVPPQQYNAQPLVQPMHPYNTNSNHHGQVPYSSTAFPQADKGMQQHALAAAYPHQRITPHRSLGQQLQLSFNPTSISNGLPHSLSAQPQQQQHQQQQQQQEQLLPKQHSGIAGLIMAELTQPPSMQPGSNLTAAAAAAAAAAAGGGMPSAVPGRLGLAPGTGTGAAPLGGSALVPEPLLAGSGGLGPASLQSLQSEVERLRSNMQAATAARDEMRQRAERAEQRQQQQSALSGSSMQELQQQVQALQQQLMFSEEELTGLRRRGSDREGRLNEALGRAAVLEREVRRREEQLVQAEEELRQARERLLSPRRAGGMMGKSAAAMEIDDMEHAGAADHCSSQQQQQQQGGRGSSAAVSDGHLAPQSSLQVSDATEEQQQQQQQQQQRRRQLASGSSMGTPLNSGMAARQQLPDGTTAAKPVEQQRGVGPRQGPSPAAAIPQQQQQQQRGPLPSPLLPPMLASLHLWQPSIWQKLWSSCSAELSFFLADSGQAWTGKSTTPSAPRTITMDRSQQTQAHCTAAGQIGSSTNSNVCASNGLGIQVTFDERSLSRANGMPDAVVEGRGRVARSLLALASSSHAQTPAAPAWQLHRCMAATPAAAAAAAAAAAPGMLPPTSGSCSQAPHAATPLVQELLLLLSFVVRRQQQQQVAAAPTAGMQSAHALSAESWVQPLLLNALGLLRCAIRAGGTRCAHSRGGLPLQAAAAAAAAGAAGSAASRVEAAAMQLHLHSHQMQLQQYCLGGSSTAVVTAELGRSCEEADDSLGLAALELLTQLHASFHSHPAILHALGEVLVEVLGSVLGPSKLRDVAASLLQLDLLRDLLCNQHNQQQQQQQQRQRTLGVQALTLLLQAPAARLDLQGALSEQDQVQHQGTQTPDHSPGGPVARLRQLAAAAMDCLHLESKAVDDASTHISRVWGPFELQRRALALLALMLEHQHERELAALCGAPWLPGTGLAQRLICLADAAAAGAAAAAAAAAEQAGVPGSRSGSSRAVELSLGQRACLTQEALLMLKAMLLACDELRFAALHDLTSDSDATSLVRCATARLAGIKETWGGFTALQQQQQEWPQVLLAPWAQKLHRSTSVAATSAGSRLAASPVGCGLEAIVALNTSILRRFLHRVQYMQDQGSAGH